MNERDIQERLHDFVDGRLDDAESRAVERYLETSAAGRDTVAFLRSLRRRARQLPESIEPPRDLWPRIEERMAPLPLTPVQPAAPAPSWWPRLEAPQWGALAAVAVVLVMLSSATTAWLLDASGGAADVATDATGAADAAGIARRAAHAVEIEQLRAVLDANRNDLDADTVSTIETNLRVIDRAIRRAREALDADPGNASLARMLDNNYRRKLQLLQRANRFIELN